MSTVVACPICQQEVPVPDEQLGQPLRCPGCEQVFTPSNTAVRSAVPPPLPPPLPPDEAPVWERPPEDDLAAPLDDDEAADIEADVQEGDWQGRREEKKARRKDRRESGYFGELARKQRKMLSPHHGPMVLVLGIMSLLFCSCWFFAIGACACGYYAYQMGSNDLQEIYARRMDPSGETFAKIGRTLGVIGMVLSAPVILLSLISLVVVLIRAAVGPPGG